jgi:hypothetical protein
MTAHTDFASRAMAWHVKFSTNQDIGADGKSELIAKRQNGDGLRRKGRNGDRNAICGFAATIPQTSCLRACTICASRRESGSHATLGPSRKFRELSARMLPTFCTLQITRDGTTASLSVSSHE